MALSNSYYCCVNSRWITEEVFEHEVKKTHRGPQVNECVTEDIEHTTWGFGFPLSSIFFVFFQCNLKLCLLYKQTIHYLNIVISSGTILPSNITMVQTFWSTSSLPFLSHDSLPWKPQSYFLKHCFPSSSSSYLLLTFTMQLKQWLLRYIFDGLSLNRYPVPISSF